MLNSQIRQLPITMKSVDIEHFHCHRKLFWTTLVRVFNRLGLEMVLFIEIQLGLSATNEGTFELLALVFVIL